MYFKLTLGAAAVATVALLMPLSAAPIAPRTATVEDGLVQLVHLRGRAHCNRALRRARKKCSWHRRSRYALCVRREARPHCRRRIRP